MWRHLLVLTILLAGCDDEDRTKTECGYPGNGCWGTATTEPSCNAGYVCNVKRKGEALKAGVCPATYGVCEVARDGSVPAPDTKSPPKPDGKTGSDALPDLVKTEGLAVDQSLPVH